MEDIRKAYRQTIVSKTKKKKNVKEQLPLINTIFDIHGYKYKIIFVNEGKGRFTCKPIQED